MAREKRAGFQAELVQYLIDEYYGGDQVAFASRVRYGKQQIDSWLTGKRKPQKATVRWLLSSTLAPEFRVAAEFEPVEFPDKTKVRSILGTALGEHKKTAGVYAFYDSMCSVIYIGKASSRFLEEMYQQLNRPLGIAFPKAVTKAPLERWQAVRYISAYEIPYVDHLDYPKHVEALVLRLSKPIGNKVLGQLKRSEPPSED